MTHVLAVLGGGKADVSVIGTAAAVAEIARAQVRRVSPAGDLSAQRAAGQVLRALHSPGALLVVLEGMSCRGRSGGVSCSDLLSRWSWCRLRRGAGGLRSAGYSCRWTGRRSRLRRWPRRWSSSLALESIWWCCTCSTLRPFQVLGSGRARQGGLGGRVPGTLLRAARGAAGAPQRGGRGARPRRGTGRNGLT